MSYHHTNPNIPRLENEVLEYCRKIILYFPKKKMENRILEKKNK